MRASIIVAMIVALHILGLGIFVSLQGCGTIRPTQISTPPPPPMPPSTSEETGSVIHLPPVAKPLLPITESPVSEITYEVKKGDSLSKIAKKYGVGTKELASINGISNPNQIQIGQALSLPFHASKGSGSSVPISRPHLGTYKGPTLEYVVKKGDSLSKISATYGTKVALIKEINHLMGDLILIGQKLRVPSDGKTIKSPTTAFEPDEPESTPSFPDSMTSSGESVSGIIAPSLEPLEQPLDYTIQEGDTLEDIAKLFIVRKEEILQLNNLSGEESIRPGKTIKIPPADL